jgi:SAM-dependent methyltransferase
MSSQIPGDLFSGHAKDYAGFRPVYPEELIHYISHLVRYRGVVWDCACGNGQLSLPLAGHFNLVMATDISEQQIAHAPGHKGIMYTVQRAEQTDFPDEYFDMIVIGQAIHWFDHDAFYSEVNRVLAPDGVIVAVGYGLMTINEEVDAVLNHFYKNITGTYWPTERAHLDAGYTTIPWPFDTIETPSFEMTHHWGFDQMMGYLNTWSAVKLYEKETGVNPLTLVVEDFRKAWGSDNTRLVRFPLFVKAGKKKLS